MIVFNIEANTRTKRYACNVGMISTKNKERKKKGKPHDPMTRKTHSNGGTHFP